MRDLLDSDSPDYDPEAVLEAADNDRKAGRERGEVRPKIRILLLEDHDSLASSIVRALEASGFVVSRFRDLHEARSVIPPIGFDVLLCDYELPDGTGIDFLYDGR